MKRAPPGNSNSNSGVRLELFDYALPAERIAQTPLEPRDASRLLVLQGDGARVSRRFRDLPELLEPGDLLVFNDTRVLPARLIGEKLGADGAPGARIELLLLRRREGCVWEALVHPGRRVREGVQLRFGENLMAEAGERVGDGIRQIRFRVPGYDADEAAAVDAAIHVLGRAPLPPYIHTELADPERYQTIYARSEGAAAAPTAGLHFTPQVFEALRSRGVNCAWVTLHVGLGTFRPVACDEIEEHTMHEEWCAVPPETAAAIAGCRGRVIAVGTTAVRCLESRADAQSNRRRVLPGAGATGLYITPGYRFRIVDALITNFHTPRSSLLILVSAFAGRDAVAAAYEQALAEGYRFLSFGDAMFIERGVEI